VKQIYEVAVAKQKDEHLKHIELEQLCRSIIGSAASMGLEIVGDYAK
jgi:large subunit ribosomal protein L11